jgi:hypothetical protein
MADFGYLTIMNWKPISKTDLDALIARNLEECSVEQRQFFANVAVEPVKWKQSPWGDDGGGFWVVAVMGNRVLWYNDIEDGFNVSRFQTEGSIPSDEYWCNQAPLKWAMPALAGSNAPSFGPPEPVRDE